MRITSMRMHPYGEFEDVEIPLSPGLTVVHGVNEAGKSTALDALADFLWGIPSGSRRTSSWSRSRLRLTGRVTRDDAESVLVRSAKDIRPEGGTPVEPEWIDAEGCRAWWRTRLGLDHDGLRKAGADAFVGKGDIADVIFAAREGVALTGLRQDLVTEAERLFRKHHGAKNVALRQAGRGLLGAEKTRDEAVMRADRIRDLRAEVDARTSEMSSAEDELLRADRAHRHSDENSRALNPVLNLVALQGDVADVDAEGPRLSESDLTILESLGRRLESGSRDIDRLATALTDAEAEIAALTVDDALLDQTEAIDALHAELAAREADLARAETDHGPGRRRAEERIREILRRIGVEAEDFDSGLARAAVRADHSAELTRLASLITAAEQTAEAAGQTAAEALAGLAEEGMSVADATASGPAPEEVRTLRDALVKALNYLDLRSTAVGKAERNLAALGLPASDAVETADSTADRVERSRADRDTAWQGVRVAWITGTPPEETDRIRQADAIDSAIADADRAADDHAERSARTAEQAALLRERLAGYARAEADVDAATVTMHEARGQLADFEEKWDSLWAAAGLASAPTQARADDVMDLVLEERTAGSRQRSARATAVGLSPAWTSALASAGLESDLTPTMWLARAAQLSDLQTRIDERDKMSRKEGKGRSAWARFRTKAIAALEDLGAVPPGAGAALSDDEVAVQVRALHLKAQTNANAKAARDTHLIQVQRTRTERDRAKDRQSEAEAGVADLARTYSVNGVSDLDALADRTVRHTTLKQLEAAALTNLTHALDPGSGPDEVVERLRELDAPEVALALTQADAQESAATDAHSAAATALALAQDELRRAEGATGAFEAEARVSDAEARVAEIAERWALLILEIELLDRALAEYARDESTPLIERAGEILAHLTEGRWSGLNAVDAEGVRVLEVLRADAQPLRAADLSEGTRDQVFFALRLAAIEELAEDRDARGKPDLPVVLDDVLMAFDDERTGLALDILGELADEVQVVLFTHHEHVAEAAEERGVGTVIRMA